MEMIDIQAQMECLRKEREEKVKETRIAMIKDLGAAGITAVKAEYSGYGDSGNVDDLDVTPPVKLEDDLETRLQDFIWEMCYNQHPGFEINDGAQGTFEWDVPQDDITIEHGQNYMQVDWTKQEGL